MQDFSYLLTLYALPFLHGWGLLLTYEIAKLSVIVNKCHNNYKIRKVDIFLLILTLFGTLSVYFTIHCFDTIYAYRSVLMPIIIGFFLIYGFITDYIFTHINNNNHFNKLHNSHFSHGAQSHHN